MSLAAIRAAAAKVRAITWTHGDDCPHRYCDEPDDCADGSAAAFTEGVGTVCDSPGVPCDCYVSDIARLLAAIDAAEPEASLPWNFCPTCKGHVGDGEYHDGGEYTCIGCRVVYVAVAYEGGAWALVAADPEAGKEGASDARR